ncbi:MAG TPA: FGGY-family carbohydrate kinase [Aggregatilineales bacterium]|nr:FGGY-family carbohydrate kinase [Aggregatilineales bacterium]
MTADLVIGVDSSTTACKAIAWDRTGKLVAQARATFELISPHPNWYEQRADDWWDALCQSLKGVVAQVGADRIAALCITHQRESFVPVDEQCQPIRNAILWVDDRCHLEVAELDQRFGNAAIQDLTGKGPSTKQSLPELVWLQNHEPEVVRRAYKFLDVHAFLVYRLIGEWVTSLPCADPMGVVDMRKGDWATDLIQKIGLRPDQFVTIKPAGSILSTLHEKAALATGLPAGLPVVAGAGDGQSAGLGANITTPGKAYLNLGTAMVSGAHSEEYVADTAFRTLCSPIAGAFVPEEVLGGGTFTVSWFVENFGPDMNGVHLPVSAEEVLELAASKLPPGSLGLMLVPYWNGVMPPYWDPGATGIMVGWTGAHRREHFYRAIMEGISYEHRLAMEGVQKATGQTIHEYILMGGGSRSALWCQIVADMTGAKVTRASTTEATNLGAGILAAAAAGWYPTVREAANAMTATERSFEPNSKTAAVYDRLFREVYVGLFPAVKQYTDRLTHLTYHS